MIGLLAPGFSADPQRFALASELTRITFPYLLLVSLVTVYGGILNTLGYFASAAAAPIFLNLSMMLTLALAASSFRPPVMPLPGASCWPAFLKPCWSAAMRRGAACLPAFAAFKLDDDVKRFFKALGPATLGSGGTQIALFADTIIASFLSAGALSALYYADRLNQLPIGVIGIAVGTVLLPEMASRIARSDEAGAQQAQNRAVELTLLLSIPCLVAFLLVPDFIMLALFARGAFTAANASASGATLAAYAIGLLPFVLLRSVTATFLARGDTATPVKALFVSVAVNVALKIALMGSLAQVGLALATSAGVWINFLLLLWLAWRARLIMFDERLQDFGVETRRGRHRAGGGAVGWTEFSFHSCIRRRHSLPRRDDARGTGRHWIRRLRRRHRRDVRSRVVCRVRARAQRYRFAGRRSSAVRLTFRRSLLRSVSIAISRSILLASSSRIRSSAPVTATPSSDSTMSPAARPARSAGLPASTFEIITALSCVMSDDMAKPARQRDLRGRDADVCAADTAMAHQFAQHEACCVGGNGKADALGADNDGGVDADHLAARRHQRAAGIAGIERRVGLDDVVDQPAAARTQRAAERGDHAGGYGRFEAEWIADGDHQLPALERLGIAERRGRQRHVLFHPDQGQIGIRVVADQPRVEVAAVRGRHRKAVRPADHVRIGQNKAIGSQNNARSGARTARVRRNVQADHRRSEPFGDAGDGLRIGVEQRRLGWRGIMGRVGREFVEHRIARAAG